MAFFALNSEITIGDFSFSAVNEVRIERTMHTWEDRAYIRVPSVARIQRDGSATPTDVTTASLFTDGAKVAIKLGYNGELRTEFEGFVKRRSLGLILEVECEGYARLLRQKVIRADLSKGMHVKQLLEIACAGTGVSVECAVDFKLYGLYLANTDGCKILSEIVKCSDHALTIFFIEPKKLFCGLVYTPYLSGTDALSLPQETYRLGWNAIQDNGLRERIPDERIQVYYNGMTASGDTVRTQSDEKAAKRKIKALLNGIHEEKWLKAFCNEKEKHNNYSGYEGSLTGFLQPYCAPGYTVTIMDGRYPERDGRYLVEGTKVVYGVNGARRILEIGLKVG